MTDIGKPFERDAAAADRDDIASQPVGRQALHFAFALPFTCLPRRLRYALGPIIGVLLIGLNPPRHAVCLCDHLDTVGDLHGLTRDFSGL